MKVVTIVVTTTRRRRSMSLPGALPSRRHWLVYGRNRRSRRRRRRSRISGQDGCRSLHPPQPLRYSSSYATSIPCRPRRPPRLASLPPRRLRGPLKRPLRCPVHLPLRGAANPVPRIVRRRRRRTMQVRQVRGGQVERTHRTVPQAEGEVAKVRRVRRQLQHTDAVTTRRLGAARPRGDDGTVAVVVPVLPPHTGDRLAEENVVGHLRYGHGAKRLHAHVPQIEPRDAPRRGPREHDLVTHDTERDDPGLARTAPETSGEAAAVSLMMVALPRRHGHRPLWPRRTPRVPEPQPAVRAGPHDLPAVPARPPLPAALGGPALGGG